MAVALKKSVDVQVQAASDLGSQIFVYTHYRTRQTIYSLYRRLDQKDVLNQLTFVGKKSVPASLRKDMWTPLCIMDFPNRFQGLHAYARLREFRERHETEWPEEDMRITKGPKAGNMMSTRERSFKLMDQKANSIADMAAVLAMQARPPEKDLVEKMEQLVNNKKRVKKDPKTGEVITTFIHRKGPRARNGANSKIGHRVFEFQGNINGTKIWWAHPPDAEYAETWPAEVRHGPLAVNRGFPIWPPPIDILKKTIEIDLPETARKPIPRDNESKRATGRRLRRARKAQQAEQGAVSKALMTERLKQLKEIELGSVTRLNDKIAAAKRIAV